MTRLAVIGWPIAHSLSPAMHAAALNELAKKEPLFSTWRYERVPVPSDGLAAFAKEVRSDPAWRGFNVTLPHKVAIVPMLDAIEASAEAAGAVNTVVREASGRLVGRNTDVEGFARSVEEAGISFSGKRILVLGAGGAARAVVAACAARGVAAIHVAARNVEAAATLSRLAGAAAFGASTLDRESLVGLQPDLLVQATSASLDPEAGEALAAALPLEAMPAVAVIDLVYRPRVTALLSRAAALGRATIDGTGMLVHQGALALAQWTERDVDVEAMRSALRLE